MILAKPARVTGRKRTVRNKKVREKMMMENKICGYKIRYQYQILDLPSGTT